MPSATFGFTGGWQTFNVPNNVEWLTVELDGAGSGVAAGGRVTGRLAVKDTQTLYILVGEAGKAPSGKDGGGTAFGGGGAGGDASNGQSGGRGGGGASAIRLGSATGSIKAVAGGAGGRSGDNGAGGDGGADIGESGSVGTAGAASIANATGGTQTQRGQGGTSSWGAAFNGNDGATGGLGRGGKGGQNTSATSDGGGGGGGGFRAGGGGVASAETFAPGGGGAGGSNYSDPLSGAASARGAGGTGNGQVILTWSTPPPANQPPSPPTEVKVDGQFESDEMATKSTGTVKITAQLDDPNAGQSVRMRVTYWPDGQESKAETKFSGYIAQTNRAEVTLNGLSQNTLWRARLHTQDEKGLFSTSHSTISFWTNRKPNAPELTAPSDNATFTTIDPVSFEWNKSDPDPNDPQVAYELRHRKAATPSKAAGQWTTYALTTDFDVHVVAAGTFRSNTFYDWTVRTKDGGGLWGPWADFRSFYIEGTTAPPTLVEPVNGAAVVTTEGTTFEWNFIDPDVSETQTKADIRYRVVGTEDWVTVFGDTSTPGTQESWTFAPDTFAPGFHYEWQARTYDTLIEVSDWSDSEDFWTTKGLGSANEVAVPTISEIQGSLGCGTYRVYIYDRGGQVIRGEVTPISHMQWGRKRDDISNTLITINGFGEDCGQLLADTHCWMHEVVIFRDGERVWEGPITRLTYTPTEIEIEAKDVMAYVYRRILRQGFNDAHRIVNGQDIGGRSVVDRSGLIILNALVYDDPNVLPYVRQFRYDDDAPQNRAVQDWSATAWEVIDDFAATAGLDYTVIGRSICLWDTHRPIGKLPELRDKDFSNPPVVSEYGMLTANVFGVTNNSGVYGVATRDHPGDQRPGRPFPYGFIEQLASAYGETAATVEDALTPDDKEKLVADLNEQAERNIAGRYPTPVIVRVPDNSALSAEAPVGINQLVPGVWIPLRSVGTVREVAQWQKLDSITVEVTPQREQVQVVLSPAPDGGADPDSVVVVE